MIKPFLSTVTILFLWGAATPASAQGKQVNGNTVKTDLKFLNEISVDVAPVYSEPVGTVSKSTTTSQPVIKPEAPAVSPEIEKADKLQFKYAQIMDTEVEMLRSMNVFKVIDEWFGTRYRLGGTGKNGIDCSAFMQVLFTSLYGIGLPRTAREQFHSSRRISRTDLREGDLVFFNTTGGISHVGMYLQNNKFVHASSSGVTISDLFDDYWVRRFVGVGRIDEMGQAEAFTVSKL